MVRDMPHRSSSSSEPMLDIVWRAAAQRVPVPVLSPASLAVWPERSPWRWPIIFGRLPPRASSSLRSGPMPPSCNVGSAVPG